MFICCTTLIIHCPCPCFKLTNYWMNSVIIVKHRIYFLLFRREKNGFCIFKSIHTQDKNAHSVHNKASLYIQRTASAALWGAYEPEACCRVSFEAPQSIHQNKNLRICHYFAKCVINPTTTSLQKQYSKYSQPTLLTTRVARIQMVVQIITKI